MRRALIPCDGLWHPIRIRITPSVGSFHPGLVFIDAALQLFSREKGDFDIFTHRGVQLRR
jgi:hypothetical protein